MSALLERERDRLDRLANHLLVHEVATNRQLTELLGPRPPRGAPGTAGRGANRIAACPESAQPEQTHAVGEA